jgi:hypothetical protein
MKAKKPYWDIARIQRLASAGQILLTEAKAKASFTTFHAAEAAARDVIIGLDARQFAETLRQTSVCDVYGVIIKGAGWYLKLTIDTGPPEELIVVSLHPLDRPLKTNAGMVKP